MQQLFKNKAIYYNSHWDAAVSKTHEQAVNYINADDVLFNAKIENNDNTCKENEIVVDDIDIDNDFDD